MTGFKLTKLSRLFSGLAGAALGLATAAGTGALAQDVSGYEELPPSPHAGPVAPADSVPVEASLGHGHPVQHPSRGVKNVRCAPWWAHRHGAWGEVLWLRPGDTDVVYAIEQDDSVPGAFPTGLVGRANIDDNAGYRVGFSLASSERSSLVASYSNWKSSTQDSVTARAGNFLNSEVIHPSTTTVAAQSLASSARSGIDFQLVDVAYRHLLVGTKTSAINWSGGFRYGNLEQDFVSQQNVGAPNGLTTVGTDLDFEGFGLTLGLEAESRSCKTGLLIYGRGLSSFLGGDWKGTYRQTSQFGGGVVANEYEEYRVTPVTELELGFGWQSDNGRVRATIGYLTSAWFNSVSTRDYLEAVRNNDYNNVDETITFDGMTSRIELRF